MNQYWCSCPKPLNQITPKPKLKGSEEMSGKQNDAFPKENKTNLAKIKISCMNSFSRRYQV